MSLNKRSRTCSNGKKCSNKIVNIQNLYQSAALPVENDGLIQLFDSKLTNKIGESEELSVALRVKYETRKVPNPL